jgi:peptide/nickel transport system substrate-binding protein
MGGTRSWQPASAPVNRTLLVARRCAAYTAGGLLMGRGGDMRESARWVWLVSWIAMSALPACTRGKAKDPAAAPTGPAEDKLALNANAGPDQASVDWTEGRLPASVLEGTPVPGGELTVAIESDPPSLSTAVDSDWIASRITEHRVYQALIRLDVMHPPKYEFMPELAESWELSEDKKTYTFHLRKGVKFHDGTPFTARDCVATFDKVQDPTTKAAHIRALLEELASYSAPDDFTFVTVWKRPYAFTLNTLEGIAIQPAKAISRLSGKQFNDAATNPLNRKPIGTGPFKFVTWESSSKIVIERYANYWGTKPYLDKITFRIVPDATVRLQLAERGELDLVPKVTSDQWRRMDSPVLKSDWNRSRFVPNQFGWIGWNEERPMFADKRARRALTMLVDRPGIIDKLLYGLPRATECTFYWDSAQCNPELKPLPYDPPAAIKLLDELGWKDTNNDGIRDKDGKPFQFVLMLPSGSEEAARWSAKLKEDLQRAGIGMDIQRVEWSSFTKRLTEHSFDACTLLWANSSPYEDPSQIWHSTSIKGGSNYIGFKNAEVDKLLEAARVEFDVPARDALYRKFGAILHDEQPYTILYTRPELDLLHKRIKGAKANLASWSFETIWIDPALRRK